MPPHMNSDCVPPKSKWEDSEWYTSSIGYTNGQLKYSIEINDVQMTNTAGLTKENDLCK